MSIQYFFEGERYRAVVRFWKTLISTFVSSLLVPIAGGADWQVVLSAWPQAAAVALLAALAMGGDKMYRAVKSKT